MNAGGKMLFTILLIWTEFAQKAHCVANSQDARDLNGVTVAPLHGRFSELARRHTNDFVETASEVALIRKAGRDGYFR